MRITELEGNHTVYVLDRQQELGVKSQTDNAQIINYGLGLHADKFVFDSTIDEYDNYRNLDVETLQAYFEEEQFLVDLKAENFDLGIGGLNLADSALFRHLDVSYMKMS